MNSKKPFKVISLDRLTKKGVVVVSLKDLIRQVRKLFNVRIRHKIEIVLEEDGTEIVNDGFLFSLDNHTKLIVLEDNDTWTMAPLLAQPMTNVYHDDKLNDFKEINILGLSITATSSDRYLSCFHPKKAVLALAVSNCTHVMIWKAVGHFFIPFSNWNKEEVLHLHSKRLKQITDMQWNMDGTQLAVCCKDGTLVVWRYPSCDIRLKVQLSSKFSYLHWNPSWEDYFLTFSADANDNGDIFLWNSSPYSNLTTNLVCKIDPQKRTDKFDFVFWTKENEVAIGLEESDLFEIREMEDVWEKNATQRVIKQLKCGKKSDIIYNKSTEYFASRSEEKRILNFWSLDREGPVYSLQVQSDCMDFGWLNTKEKFLGIESAQKSESHMTLICLLKNGNVILWNPIGKDQKKQTRVVCEVPKNVDWISFSPNGKYFALVNGNHEIMLWSTETWSLIFKSEPRDFKPTLISFSWLFGERSYHFLNKAGWGINRNKYNYWTRKRFLKLVVTNGDEIRFFEGTV